MTSSVLVTAHCASNKEVVVELDSNTGYNCELLQNGEKREYTVYDSKTISVYEREKEND